MVEADVNTSRELRRICRAQNYLEHATPKIDKIMIRVESQVEKLKEYLQALSTSAVTGKIKVAE
jgi:hypothetical protein